MEPIENSFLAQYISQLEDILGQAEILINLLNTADFRGISSERALTVLHGLKNDISQHKSCIQDYEQFIREVMN